MNGRVNSILHTSLCVIIAIGLLCVGLAALKNAREYIGIDLNPDYLKLSKERLEPFLSQQTLTSFL
jgi:hypothetical protein